MSINSPVFSTGVAKFIMNANIRTHLAAQEDEMKASIVDTTASKATTAGGPSSSSSGVVNAKGEDEDVGRAADELRSFFIKDASKYLRNSHIRY